MTVFTVDRDKRHPQGPLCALQISTNTHSSRCSVKNTHKHAVHFNSNTPPVSSSLPPLPRSDSDLQTKLQEHKKFLSCKNKFIPCSHKLLCAIKSNKIQLQYRLSFIGYIKGAEIGNSREGALQEIRGNVVSRNSHFLHTL